MKSVSYVASAVLAITVAASSCTSVLGEFDFNGKGGSSSASSSASTSSGTPASSSTTSTSTTSSSTTTTSSTGTGGSPTCMACADTSNCTAPSGDCAIANCEKGCCGTTNLGAGVSCSTSGGSRCDGNGNCVACLTPSDCPASETTCASPTCANGACGSNDAKVSTPCSDNEGKVCDGNGNCVFCGQASDCPATGTTCASPVCMTDACGVTNASSGTKCTDSGGAVCDGSGHCLGCLATSDCTPSATKCATVVCTGNACVPDPAAKGTACSDNGGTICDGNGHCLPNHCTDKMVNGDETDVDCGGAACPACPDTEHCKVATDCQSGYCTGTVCTACSTDAQCGAGTYCDTTKNGGTCTPTKALGGACTGTDQCSSGFCADGVCCDSACTGSCSACNLTGAAGTPGTCGNVPDGSNSPSHPCGGVDVCCGGACSDTQTDVKNCGGCGDACPAEPTACLIPTCGASSCSKVPAAKGASCNDNGGQVCTGTGTCVGCNSNADCSGGGICCNNVCALGDPNNCGACGHGCLGGGCNGQQCQPILLASGQSNAYGIAVDANNVYWADLGTGTNGSIMKCAINNCGGTLTSLATALTNPAFVTADATSVYWTSDTGVLKCAIAGCGGAPTTLCSTTNCQGQRPIVTDSTSVYWPHLVGSTTSVVMKCANAGCGGTPTTIASAQDNTLAVAIDSTNLYWTDSGTGTNGTIMKCALANCGGTTTAIASGLIGPYYLTSNGTSVFWTYENGEGAPSSLSKVPVIGGTAMTLVPGGQSLIALVADTTNVYFTDQGQGVIDRMPINGGTVTTLANGQSNPLGITQDAVSIYWTSFSGTVWRLAK